MINAADRKAITAASFAKETGVDQYAFRRYLRSTDVRVGRGKLHTLPTDTTGPEAQAIVAAFKASKFAK